MKKICEYCESEHDGNYGSGRFCDRRCANGFSTRAKRKEISKKVSKKMKGKKIPIVLTKESRRKMSEAATKSNRNRIRYKMPLSKRKWSPSTRKLIFEKRGRECEICGWNEINPTTGLIPSEVHHIDGNKNNNNDDNITILCPNHHSLTSNYMFFGRKHASNS